MWALLVTWAVVQSGAYQDMWLISNPVFTTQEDCMQYGMVFREQIYKDAMQEFNTSELPNTLFCVDEAAIDFLNKKGVQIEQL